VREHRSELIQRSAGIMSYRFRLYGSVEETKKQRGLTSASMHASIKPRKYLQDSPSLRCKTRLWGKRYMLWRSLSSLAGSMLSFMVALVKQFGGKVKHEDVCNMKYSLAVRPVQHVTSRCVTLMYYSFTVPSGTT
jgi:hypothetical protein